jgi:pyruvate/2-oxoacid:ferredoxin oxidoreductase alpha subunit
MSHDEPMFVSEHRRSYQETEEMETIYFDDADITIYAIGVARFNAVETVKILKEENIKCNLVHMLWLKPFSLPEADTQLGLVVDSDFEICGASQMIAYELMRRTRMPVEALGRPDRSVGIGQHLENATPSVERIVNKVKEMVWSKQK